MSYKIDKDVPMPDISISPRLKYPWNEMMPGNSVLVPLEEVSKGGVNTIRSSAISWLRRNRPDWGCTVRMESTGARVWFYDKSDFE